MNNSKIYIGLINPKSPSNVGAVMRAAGCYGADAVLYTGDRYNSAMKFQTDTKNVTQTIPLTGVEDLVQCTDDEMKIICIELTEGATPLPVYQHPQKALYIFGPEDSSISQQIIDKAHAVVYVPTIGCMNLAASVNVVLYDRLAKSKDNQQDNELVRKSRDRNNKTKIKSPF